VVLSKYGLLQVYQKIEEGADVNFVFGSSYSCPEGYTPLMVAAHRGRYLVFGGIVASVRVTLNDI